MSLFLQLLTNGLVNGALFAILAVAFGLVYRSARVFHIAFGGLYVVSAYLLFAGVAWWGLPVWAAALFAIVASAALGVGVDAGFYRFFEVRRSGPGVVLVASLGLFIVLENLVAMLFGNEVRTIPRGIAQSFSFAGIRLTSVQLLQLLIGIAVLVGFGVAIRRVRALKAIWAMGDEPELLAILGNPLRRYRMIVFGLATALAAVPACLIGLDTGMSPHMGMHYLLIAAVGMLAGGTDRFMGWVAGGFLLAILHSLIVWKLSSQWMDLATFGTLVLILLFRPQGIFGVKRRLEEAS